MTKRSTDGSVPGRTSPTPAACIVVGGEVVGWIDYDCDADHDWLGEGEVNIGYFVFATHRGSGYATRALELLMCFLAEETPHTTASLLIDPHDEQSLAVAERCRFERQADLRGERYFKRAVGAKPADNVRIDD